MRPSGGIDSLLVSWTLAARRRRGMATVGSKGHGEWGLCESFESLGAVSGCLSCKMRYPFLEDIEPIPYFLSSHRLYIGTLVHVAYVERHFLILRLDIPGFGGR